MRNTLASIPTLPQAPAAATRVRHLRVLCRLEGDARKVGARGDAAEQVFELVQRALREASSSEAA